MEIQNLFYGFGVIDESSKSELLMRIPALLDRAKDDLVHTYRDEIQMLVEN